MLVARRAFRGGSRARSSGFTVVELMLAMALVAALVAIAIPLYRGYQERARTQLAMADIRHIQSEIDRDIAEYNRVPESIAHLASASKLDPWGNPYRYLNVSSSAPKGNRGKARKDKNLVPINSDFDLYSAGKDGESLSPLTSKKSQDDIIRANDGAFIGLAADY